MTLSSQEPRASKQNVADNPEQFISGETLEKFFERLLQALDRSGPEIEKEEPDVTIHCPREDEVHSLVPAHVRQGYTLALDEQFEGNVLDSNTWSSEYLWGRDLTINSEEQYYVASLEGDTRFASPFSFDANGDLVITAKPIEGEKPVTRSGIDGGQNYTSGIIHTRDSLCFTHGYVEVCAKVPKADGAWPATWLLNCFYYNNASEKAATEGILNPNDKFNPEIDFMEMVDGPNYNGSNNVKFAYHYFTGDRDPASPNYSRWSIGDNNFLEVDANTGARLSSFNQFLDCDGNSQFSLPDYAPGNDFSDDFHIYAVDWTPDYIHYYVDGQLIRCINTKSIISDQSMYLLINFAVGGVFPFGRPGTPGYRLADPLDYPAQMIIRSARIYTL